MKVFLITNLRFLFTQQENTYNHNISYHLPSISYPQLTLFRYHYLSSIFSISYLLFFTCLNSLTLFYRLAHTVQYANKHRRVHSAGECTAPQSAYCWRVHSTAECTVPESAQHLRVHSTAECTAPQSAHAHSLDFAIRRFTYFDLAFF